jgi:UDP-N-acetyl-D-mannosaminuronate dehydrogenase
MAAVDAGWAVIGVDNLEAKVAQINSGYSPVEDISDAQLQAAITRGLYKATTDFSTIALASVMSVLMLVGGVTAYSIQKKNAEKI